MYLTVFERLLYFTINLIHSPKIANKRGRQEKIKKRLINIVKFFLAQWQ